ncbi:D-alanyl-D-alanine carboxypeptidase family protein [Streptomyces sp. NPDC002701]|uniref:D-alanyl-D-alanine carboxypeptidase family protein n=1 Tax=unclassified Streptomyces TaxID=2593676 RepID=UPI0036D13AE4
MTRTPSSARTTTRRLRRLPVVGPLVVLAVITAAIGHQVAKSSPPSAAAPSHALRSGHLGALGEADGVVPDGVTVFDDAVPAVAHLDAALLDALRRAATAAADDGVHFYVTSGRRSPAYQNRLLREAVSEYGSQDEAARWVATAAPSPHVSADAVGIGRSDCPRRYADPTHDPRMQR